MDLWSTSSGEFKTVLFYRLSRLQCSVLANVTEKGCIECLTCSKSGQNSTCMLHGWDISVKREERRCLLFPRQDARCNPRFRTNLLLVLFLFDWLLGVIKWALPIARIFILHYFVLNADMLCRAMVWEQVCAPSCASWPGPMGSQVSFGFEEPLQRVGGIHASIMYMMKN